jgi:hypothetical protein
MAQSCGDYPLDENDLLVTDSELCYISNFELRGPDDRNVLVETKVPDVESDETIITAVAKFGTNLKHVKPHCSVAKDCIITPSMGSWIDFSQSREYTVISGNRKVKKTYTITVTLQGEE